MTGCVLIIDGPIGAGKSTLAASIEAYCAARGRRVVVFRERIEASFLRLMIDSTAHRFAFQAAVLVQKIAVLEHAITHATRTGALVVVDRGLMGDYGFAQMHRDAGHISEREWQVYTSLLHAAPAGTCKPSLMHDPTQATQGEPACAIKSALLVLEPAAALERMRQRNNAAEVGGYDLAYFTRLHAIYGDLFFDDDALVRFDVSSHTTLVNGRLPDAVVERFFAALGLSAE